MSYIYYILFLIDKKTDPTFWSCPSCPSVQSFYSENIGTKSMDILRDSRRYYDFYGWLGDVKLSECTRDGGAVSYTCRIQTARMYTDSRWRWCVAPLIWWDLTCVFWQSPLIRLSHISFRYVPLSLRYTTDWSIFSCSLTNIITERLYCFKQTMHKYFLQVKVVVPF